MARRRLLIATRNAGKLRELAELLDSAPFDLVSVADGGVDDEVEETGETYCRLSGLPTLADDSGLEVDALDGEPGVRSARYAGEGASDADRIAFLVGKLDNIPEDMWSARFRCVVAVSWPDRPTELYSGACEGRIVRRGRGENGFGYDPVFYIPELGKTMAELTPAQKNRISHRSGAAKKAAAAFVARLTQ